MNRRLEELKEMRKRLEDELREANRLVREAEQAGFVRVMFHGNTRAYTYELAPGHSAKVGDYVAVHSPLTAQTELVRVVEMGRGSWRLGTKIARAIDVTVL